MITAVLLCGQVFAAGYSCPAYMKYTSCLAGYYMTNGGAYNGTPVTGNTCTACPAGYTCAGGTANMVSACSSDCSYGATKSVSCGGIANGTYNGTQTCNATKNGVAGCYTWGGTTGCSISCNGGYHNEGGVCVTNTKTCASSLSGALYGNVVWNGSAWDFTGCYKDCNGNGIADGHSYYNGSGWAACRPIPSGLGCHWGYYNNGNQSCIPCPAGEWCWNTRNTCPAGYFCPGGIYNPSSAGYGDAYKCKAGYYCPAGSSGMVSCTGATYTDSMMQTSCAACPSGYTANTASNKTAASQCSKECGLSPAADGNITSISYATQVNYPTACPTSYTITGCAAGYYLAGSGDQKCTAVGSGYYSPAGSTARTACTNKPVSSDYTGSGAGTNSCPWACNAGTYLSGGACVACEVGNYCNNNTKYSCTATSPNQINLTGATTIVNGTFHAPGAWDVSQCTCSWQFSDTQREAYMQQEKCAGGPTGATYTYWYNCRVGYYPVNPLGWGEWYTDCSACTNKPANSSYTGKGSSWSYGGGTQNDCAWTCNSGYVNSGGVCVLIPTTCPAGYYLANLTDTACSKVGNGYLSHEGSIIRYKCLDGFTTASDTSSSDHDCVKTESYSYDNCLSGTRQVNYPGMGVCSITSTNTFTCAEAISYSYSNFNCTSCAKGHYIAVVGAQNCAAVGAGYYSPAGLTARFGCPSYEDAANGYHGANVSSDAGAGAVTDCYMSNISSDWWMFERENKGYWRSNGKCYYGATNRYNNCTSPKRFSECFAGYYINNSVSAGADFTNSCTPCPAGTYTVALNSLELIGIQTTYHYSTSCTACSADTYSTTPLATGAFVCNSCPAATVSPAGSDEAADCGRRLHIGDSILYLRSAKKTTPSLNVGVNGTIYYGNMTPGSSKGALRVNYGGTTYSVHDDSM